MRPRQVILPLLLALFAACTDPAATTTSSATSTTTIAPTPSTIAAVPDLPPCLAGDQAFATDGALARGLLDGGESDAELVAGLSWTAFDGCERLVIEFATAGGAPATEPGGVRAELLRDLGIIRLRLDSRVTSTAIADRVVERQLVDQVYVVRSLDGDLYVDIHLGSAVVARASINRSPAEVIVDLRAGGPELVARPIVTDTAIVIIPTAPKAEYPFMVEGYARTSEATVVLRILEGNRLDREDVAAVADYLITWGEFRFEVPEGPNGNIDVFVGEDSPEGGDERGAHFTLVMG
ncbi:MAG: Gmad2 immunoglobulin-like domain-containing protein [Acidimicrobiia bacterium]|nr:Gmad2 immunoglobulin-like domain-containing protein [Acidimicrobiia bacterium]MDH3397457.1 Gmad2 immunoglobulin-like domain-containing protein [Acidimicrobiia bacterium]